MDEIGRILKAARYALEQPGCDGSADLISALDGRTADNLLTEFAKHFLTDNIDFYSLVHENNLILHSDDYCVIALKLYREPSRFLYSNSSRYLEYLVDVPKGAGLGHFSVKGYSSTMTRLGIELENLSLENYQRANLAAGQLLSHDRPETVIDMEGMSGGRTIKFQLSHSEPYEIVFDRDSLEAVGAYQSSYRATALITLMELVSGIGLDEFEDTIFKLVNDADPMVAWEAIRALDVFDSPRLGDALSTMALGPVAMLASRATAVMEMRR